MAARNNAPKYDARLAAREQAAAQRNAELKKDRRNRMIVIGILLLAVVGLVVGVLWINKQGEAKPLADTAAPQTAADDGAILFGNDRVAGTENSEDAVRLGVYLDFNCSYCAIFDISNSAVINEMLESGDVTLALHPVSILGTSFSKDAAGATAYLADQAPEQTLDFVNAVFALQPTESELGYLPNDQMQEIARSVGVEDAVADKMFNGDWDKWVEAASDHAVNDEKLQNEDGGFGTPTITIDGERLNEKYNWTVDGDLKKAVMEAKEAK